MGVDIKVRTCAVSVRFLSLIICLVLVCLGAGCRKKQDKVIVRILLPPAPSIVRNAIVSVEVSSLKMSSGQTIVLATMETKDDRHFREFLQNVQTYRPQALIVPTASDIPAAYQEGAHYATLPCLSTMGPCVAVIAPWATPEERVAADLVLRRISPDANAK
jgi:hypothetical protein